MDPPAYAGGTDFVTQAAVFRGDFRFRGAKLTDVDASANPQLSKLWCGDLV